jgi:predicted nucleic acid-binding protein
VIVVDASAVVDLLLVTGAAPRLADRLLRTRVSLHAPHLLDVEVIQAIRRYAISGEIPHRRGAEAVADLLDLPIHRHPHDMLAPRIWELRRSVTAYDAAYVALAEALDAPLVTRDGKLARSHGHRARIELV